MAWLVAAATLGRVVLAHATTFLGLTGLVRPDMRRDLASWWLAGAFLSGWAAFLVVDHPSRSQFFFVATTIVFGAVLTTWLVAAVVPSGRDSRLPVALAIAGGAGIAWIARRMPEWVAGPSDVGPLDAIWVPAAITAVGLGLLVVLHRRWRRWFLPQLSLVALLVLAVLGLGIPGAVERTVNTLGQVPVAGDPIEPRPDHIDYLTSSEQEAALWLQQNSDPDDIVATNAHCRPGQAFYPHCDARGFWVAALTERRIFLEGWGYTAEASALWGVDGYPTAQQLSPWPDRLALSQDVFATPSADLVAGLRDRGVTWLFGVQGASSIDPRLDEVARLAFSNDEVSIYSIEP
jgi:hypothetical protein